MFRTKHDKATFMTILTVYTFYNTRTTYDTDIYKINTFIYAHMLNMAKS